MNEKSTLIVGSKGQLGKALVQKYPRAQAVDIDELDISNSNAVHGFGWSNTNVIINAAAFTNVDRAETQEGRRIAWDINAVAVGHLATIARKHNILLIHISTDYVFDGDTKVYTEEEHFSPLSVYGASKAAGDLLVATTPKYYILRTSWVIGEGGNFVRTMLDLAKKGISPSVVNDQVGRLTFTSELVRAIDHLVASNAEYGTYNVSNSGDSISWAEITRLIFSLGGFSDLSVSDTTTKEYYKDRQDFASRPLHSTLSLEKIQSTGFTSTDWKKDLQKYLKNYQP